MAIHRPILAVLAGLALSTTGCFQAYVAKKGEETKQRFFELAKDDQVCRNVVETSFTRCWNEGMARIDDRDGIKTIVGCLNAAAGKECFEVPDR
jgi:hypothetical protein